MGKNVAVIKIPNDKSISRKHANFSLKTVDGDSAINFELNDESKYSSKIKVGTGTWRKIVEKFEHEKIDFSNEIIFEIQFGIFDAKFKIHGRPMKIRNPLGLVSAFSPLMLLSYL